ncbi:glucose-6-phosphate isomerase [Hypoxylon texense]
MAADNVYRSPDGRLRSRTSTRPKSESPEFEGSDAGSEQSRSNQLGLPPRGIPSRDTSNNDSTDEGVASDVENDTEEGGLDSSLEDSHQPSDEEESLGSPVSVRESIKNNEAPINHHPDDQRQRQRQRQRQSVNMALPRPHGSINGDADDLTLPSDNPELKHIINAIDKRHCRKYRWYVARHLRRTHDPALILSRQLYYTRIIKGHEFRKADADAGEGRDGDGSGGYKAWTLVRLRRRPFPRIDYEATRAHLEIRETFNPAVWQTEKKRMTPDRLLMILREAPRQYGWDEVVTDATVDNVLSQSGILDLAAFEIAQGIAASSSASASASARPSLLPSPSLLSSASDEDAHGQELRYDDEEEDEGHEDQLRLERGRFGFLPNLRRQSRPPVRRGSLLRHELLRSDRLSLDPETPRDRSPRSHSRAPSHREVEGRERDKKTKKKTEKNRKSLEKEVKRERKERKKMYRQRRELEAELEGLQQQFQEDLADISTQYHRRRLRVEKKLRSLQSP